jgi:alpha-L-fucosidase
MRSASWLATAALLLAAALAQAPGVPHGGGACTTDDECSLGGVCTGGSCVCDAWFTGPSCALLNLQPPLNDQAGTCGRGFASYFSWGGRAVEYAGQYHLYASFMCRHNTLDAWTTASSSAHFVAAAPEGPFAWAPAECAGDVCTPAVIPWSHNTVILPNLPGQHPALLLWHIGDGVVPPSTWAPCFNTSEVGGDALVGAPAPAASAATAAAAAAASSGELRDGWPALAPNPGGTAYVQTADAPGGPWTHFNNNTGVAINFTGSWTSALAGNPAPLLLPNGSALLYFTATPCPPGSGALAPNCIAVAVADSWRGPYDLRAAPRPVTYPESEDPFVFVDPRGHFHLLTNVNTYHRRCAAGVPCGGHAWSRDGLTFSNLTIGAFGPVITFANGTVWTNAYVERPLVTQAADGTPLSFHVGLGRSTYADSCNWAQLFCTPGAPGCGPTIPQPTPSPQAVRLVNAGRCLTFNASGFPCSGTGASAGCPVVMGDCASDGAVWLVAPGSGPGVIVSNATVPGGSATAAPQLALDVDCMSATPHTLVKVLASGATPLAYDAASGTIAFRDGMCLNTGQGPARPPCGPPSEKWLADQIQLAACTDPSAAGWTLAPASPAGSGTAAAANPTPSAPMAAFVAGPSGKTMFQHFSLCTFLSVGNGSGPVSCQWDTVLPPASLFNPTQLDTDQWMEAATLLGADEVCLTARHVDGFALWPTNSTTYSVAASPWRNGTGDVVGDFVASARKYGIKPCLYIILAFDFHANRTGVPFDAFLANQKTALTELLTRYGPISRLWWDNYALDGAAYQPVTHGPGWSCPHNAPDPAACPNWFAVSELVKSLQPDTLIVPGPDGCLVNAEKDGGTYPLYHAGAFGSYWCVNASAPTPGGPPPSYAFLAPEADYTIGEPGDNWFWFPGMPVLDTAGLWSQVTLKWAQGANLIVNVPPDNTGRVPDNIMDSLLGYRSVYDATYGVPPAAFLGTPASGPCPGLSFTVPVVPGAAFDQTLAYEGMAASGQVVDGYALEVQDAASGAWRRLEAAHGRTVGSRVLDFGLGTITGASALRWNCTAAIPGTGAGANATITYFAAFLGAPMP